MSSVLLAIASVCRFPVAFDGWKSGGGENMGCSGRELSHVWLELAGQLAMAHVPATTR
jgi:hypothetical protein